MDLLFLVATQMRFKGRWVFQEKKFSSTLAGGTSFILNFIWVATQKRSSTLSVFSEPSLVAEEVNDFI